MNEPTKPASKVLTDFDQMMSSFDRLIRMCHEALAPDHPQEKREALRAALQTWLTRK